MIQRIWTWWQRAPNPCVSRGHRADPASAYLHLRCADLVIAVPALKAVRVVEVLQLHWHRGLPNGACGFVMVGCQDVPVVDLRSCGAPLLPSTAIVVLKDAEALVGALVDEVLHIGVLPSERTDGERRAGRGAALEVPCAFGFVVVGARADGASLGAAAPGD